MSICFFFFFLIFLRFRGKKKEKKKFFFFRRDQSRAYSLNICYINQKARKTHNSQKQYFNKYITKYIVLTKMIKDNSITLS